MSLRTTSAVLFTAIYIGGFCLVATVRAEELISLPLNELGDFLAGAFGPLALAWLVFGYFQQGDELRQGTEALRMQADELKASVRQQAEMVEATRLTLRNHDSALEPLLRLEAKGASNTLTRNGPVDRARFLMVNSGAYCENLVVRVSLNDKEVAVEGFQELASGQSMGVVFDDALSEGVYYDVEISYLKSNKASGSQKFEVIRSKKEGEPSLRVVKQYG